ncbi:carbohydrate-binding module family 50 protein [Backusella circina FSU 941]|nr:carbohydrate-binding module family 50 protein [Backusella circina FSU 941]
MYFKSLSLTALGLAVLITGQFTVNAEPANDIAIPHGDLADSYLEIFSADDAEEADFDLSEDYADASTHLVKRGQSCSKYYTVKGSDTCISISKKYGISLSNFYSWNSQIKSGCPNLNNGKKYCVKMSSSSSGSSSSSCSKTHKVTNSDTCVKLAKEYGLSLSAFYKLNPSVHSSCDNLDTGKNYCVKAGSSSSSVVKKTSKKTTKKTTSSKETRKKLQTKSTFTYYWIAQEGDYSGGKSVSVKTCAGKTIGSVPENYADALVMEGTGVINSKIVNLGGCSCSGYKCFELVDRKTDPYGLTSFGSPLRPYITIASNDIKKNTKIYVPSLVGWSIPGSSKKHNGCLLVDDQSWSFKDHHIDFYVYSMDNYEKLDKAHHTTKVDIYQGGSCKLLNYL